MGGSTSQDNRSSTAYRMNRPPPARIVPVDYLVVGHVAKDVRGDGFVIGGSVTYAATCGTRLGRRMAVVTACEPGIDLQKVFPTTPVSRAPSLTSTVFENVYRDRGRDQYIRSRAAELRPEQIPSRWRDSRLVHLAPIAQELAPGVMDAFRGSFIGLTLQGWLRGWDETGRVCFKPWDGASTVLPRVSAVVFSEEDVACREDLVEFYARLAPVVAVTLGQRGARVHWQGVWRYSPAFPAQEIDPTGAGDVFATAFFHWLERTKDPMAAATFANCVASLSVEGVGTSGIPTLERVERRLRGQL